ncbi:hypothetical protein [Tistrella mobilis]|uniref:hypothetical protein n=1 Tax=Tistrella mobilis TaxID=171437 RepID=UPI00355887D5
MVPDLPYGTAAVIRHEETVWIEQSYGNPEGMPICRFRISGDGRVVLSESLVGLAWSDLYGLFTEPVMRTILSRMGLVSFHAAALVKQGAAILIMGQKGAGKSSLSAALTRAGWQPIADDLVRIVERNGHCLATAGGTVPRVNADTARALGFDPAGLATRWTNPRAVGNKFVLPPLASGTLPSEVPIRAVLLLDPRGPDLEMLDWRRLDGAQAVPGLIANLTPDPLNPSARPTRDAMRLIGGLLRQAAICRLRLPDRLDALITAAAVVDARLAEGGSVAA